VTSAYEKLRGVRAFCFNCLFLKVESRTRFDNGTADTGEAIVRWYRAIRWRGPTEAFQI
jgi:hypothetical protein